MLRTKIKADSISNLTDARYFAAWCVDFLGLPLDDTAPEYLAPANAKAIKEWLEGVEIVGEFGKMPVEKIQTIASYLELTTIQVNQFVPTSQLAILSQSYDLIQRWVVNLSGDAQLLEASLERNAAYCKYFLLDFSVNNITFQQLSAVHIALLKRLSQQLNLIVAMDFSKPSDIEMVLNTVTPFAISLKGGDEEKVGVKSFDELDELLEALELV